MRTQRRWPRPTRSLTGSVVAFSAVMLAAGSLIAAAPTAAPIAGKPAQPKGLAAADWPSFRHDFQQLGVAGSELPDDLELLWKHPAGDGCSSTAAIVGDRVYIATLSGFLKCLELKTGKEIWSYRAIEDPDPKTFSPGFKSSPTVTQELVYLGDEDGVFHAVDVKTGKKKWTFETGGEIVSSASLTEGRVLFGSYDNTLYCLDAKTGEKKWAFLTEGYVNCSPAIAGKFTFVTGCDEHLRVIDIETGKQHSVLDLQTYLIASPAVVGDMLYVGTYASEIIGVNWKKPEVTWRYKDPKKEFPYQSSAATTDRYVVAGSRDKQVHCVDRQTGKRVWAFATKGRVDSSPAIVGDRVFVGSSDGHLYELDLKTGEEQWKFRIGRDVTASPAVGRGHLVLGAEESGGFIYCFGKK